MRLYTIQSTIFYENLLDDGIAYCEHTSRAAVELMESYLWMANQLSQKVPCPKDGILPIWAWYQYSFKNPQPPFSPGIMDCGIGTNEAVYLEIEVPDEEVLLSDADLWHDRVINQEHVCNKRSPLAMKISQLEKEAGRILFFEDFPESLQEVIRESWNNIFTLSDITKSIQAVFWSLRKEHIKRAYRLVRNGEILQFHLIK